MKYENKWFKKKRWGRKYLTMAWQVYKIKFPSFPAFSRLELLTYQILLGSEPAYDLVLEIFSIFHENSRASLAFRLG